MNSPIFSVLRPRAALLVAIAGASLWTSAASAQLFMTDPRSRPSIFEEVMPRQNPSVMTVDEDEGPATLAPRLRRQVVTYTGTEAPGTVVIDTPNTYLYLVQPGGKAIRYGIGVGRDGFTWSGVQSIARKAEWPDWHPPAEMLQRQPYLPRMMAGGPGNPLGARAMYLGNSIYRIHGTNAPKTIGGRVSSGCIRMLNDDVVDLYGRVNVGTKVVVLPDHGRRGTPVAQTAPGAATASLRGPGGV
jgi:lipoprotein-anchoring transpeptidase ErfK/SrfK